MKFFCLAVLFSVLLFTGCKKQDTNVSENETQLITKATNTDKELLTYYETLAPQTLWELQQARSATARYLDIKNAFKDGYVDIGVVVEHMGSHYMKMSNVDSVFDVRKPEILVYHEKEDGSLELGAVEYAVPISATPLVAPEGFTGNGDEWERNEDFHLWLCHAWIWTNNPAGAFSPTNPLILGH
jgi:hypothetical protein